MGATSFDYLNPDWQEKARRGCFMGGKIYSDVKKGCECGGKFDAYTDFGGYDVPVCSACGAEPNRYRVKRYLPSVNGRGEAYTIRYTKSGERLTDKIRAVFTLQEIDVLLKNGKFNPYDYGKNRNKLIASIQYEKYLDECLVKMQKGRMAKGTYNLKARTYKRCMKDWCESVNVHEINYKKALELKESVNGNRAPEIVIQELRAFMNWCKDKGYIQEVCKLPPVKKSRKLTVSEIGSIDDYKKIHDLIENPVVRAAMSVMFIYPLRVSEISTLRFSDINRSNGTLTIRRRSDDGVVSSGRKSQSGDSELAQYEVPLCDDFFTAIKDIPTPIDDDFIFKTGRGYMKPKYYGKEFCEARKKAKLDHIKPGKLRHVIASLIEEKHGLGVASFFLGHSSTQMTKERYVRKRLDSLAGITKSHA